jgi:hypothetical protein
MLRWEDGALWVKRMDAFLGFLIATAVFFFVFLFSKHQGFAPPSFSSFMPSWLMPHSHSLFILIVLFWFGEGGGFGVRKIGALRLG